MSRESYHYGYDPEGTPGRGTSENSGGTPGGTDPVKYGGSGGKKDEEWHSWVGIIILFAMEIWPIALVWLLVKLFGADAKKKKPQATGFPPLRVMPIEKASSAQSTATKGSKKKSADKAKAVAQKMTKAPSLKSSTARILQVIGVLLTTFGLLHMVTTLNGISYGSWLQIYWGDVLYGASFAVAGGGMLFAGSRIRQQLKRFPKYLAVMGDRSAIAIDELSRKLGYGRRQVEKDLGAMMDRGLFVPDAYINQELGYFIRSSQADEEIARRKAAQTQGTDSPKEAEEGYSGILRNIRRANDRIADPALSEKIDKLESIAARIFKAVEGDPKKLGRIDTFLNYYLPTTQKLLDSYAEFENAGVEGENLRQAKERIAATMDSIVAGFAHQLDELYRVDAMDVDSDIRVMETMLHRDTASVEKDFGLGGGTATQAREE